MGKRYVIISIITLLLLVLPVASSQLSLGDIRAMASSPQPGDTLLVWMPGNFWVDPVVANGILYHNCTWPNVNLVRGDGTSFHVESNFWNIVSASGENYLRVIGSSTVVFYAKLTDVQTMWGGVTWMSPGITIAGRAPPQFTGGSAAPSVGGYPWFSLPMRANDIDALPDIFVKVDFTLLRSQDSKVRFGLSMWFENLDGNAISEDYIAFHDDYGGHPGDRTTVKTLQVPAIINNKLTTIEYELQRALSGGGWSVIVFYPKNIDLTDGTIIINIKPLITEIINQLVDFFGVSKDTIVWSSLGVGTLAGSEGTSIEYGYIVRDARILGPDQKPVIVETTVTSTATKSTTTTLVSTVTSTETTTYTETSVSTVTSTTTKTEIVPTTVYQSDMVTTGIIGVITLILGIIIGMFVKRGK